MMKGLQQYKDTAFPTNYCCCCYYYNDYDYYYFVLAHLSSIPSPFFFRNA